MPEVVSPNEIRTDFAQRLIRRMRGSSQAAKCTCALLEPGLVASEHLPGCPRMVWAFAARGVELLLAECNGGEDVTEGAEG